MGTKRGAAKNPPPPVVDIDDPQQLNALALRVRDFAQGRANVYRWWLRTAGALAKGNTLDDVVANAVASLFGAKRTWDPSAQPDPFEYLKSVVNSELSNLARSADNRKLDRAPEDLDLPGDDTPLSALLDAEEDTELKQQRNRFYSLLIDAISNDNDLLKLHDLFVNDGIDKPQELASRLGMSVTEVNNLKKRFMRACKNVGDTMLADEDNYD